MSQQTVLRPFALRLFTTVEKKPADLAGSGERFDGVRQVTVRADGTPRAYHMDERSRTCNGVTSSLESEILDFW